MHSKKDSLLKRWHAIIVNPHKCSKKWRDYYRFDDEGYRIVNCDFCPNFDRSLQRCKVAYGSPLRKCVVSSIEAHFHQYSGVSALEIGYGSLMVARNMIRKNGGLWTGIEPKINNKIIPTIGKGGYGLVDDIPFDKETFDLVFGIQSLEHWGQRAGADRAPSNYNECFREIARVLKPKGKIYFDAPIYFHGNEAFIMGDIDKIQTFFDDDIWKNLLIEKWREYTPPQLRYPIPEKEMIEWPYEITNYTNEQIDRIKNKNNVWMITITAEKKE